MKNYLDGGDAILEAIRDLKVEYILSSPGTEWSSVWQAMSTASVSCQQLRYSGPAVLLTVWRASASHTEPHSEPGEEKM